MLPAARAKTAPGTSQATTVRPMAGPQTTGLRRLSSTEAIEDARWRTRDFRPLAASGVGEGILWWARAMRGASNNAGMPASPDTRTSVLDSEENPWPAASCQTAGTPIPTYASGTNRSRERSAKTARRTCPFEHPFELPNCSLQPITRKMSPARRVAELLIAMAESVETHQMQHLVRRQQPDRLAIGHAEDAVSQRFGACGEGQDSPAIISPCG
jgi:hypothetical protein